MCGDCKYGICNNNGVMCNNPQSENFDMQMDYSDNCIKCRKAKTIKKKVVEPVVIEEHIANPIVEKPQEELKKEKPKKEKNYRVRAGTKTNTIYVIVCEGHIANFGDKEYGGKHSYFHEEEKAISYCKRKSTPHIKYKYIKCKILNEL